MTGQLSWVNCYLSLIHKPYSRLVSFDSYVCWLFRFLFSSLCTCVAEDLWSSSSSLFVVNVGGKTLSCGAGAKWSFKLHFTLSYISQLHCDWKLSLKYCRTDLFFNVWKAKVAWSTLSLKWLSSKYSINMFSLMSIFFEISLYEFPS